jgi:hypothetical protein
VCPKKAIDVVIDFLRVMCSSTLVAVCCFLLIRFAHECWVIRNLNENDTDLTEYTEENICLCGENKTCQIVFLA